MTRIYMEGLTTITFFKFRNNKPWAFAQMGLVPPKLKQKKGLRFFKLMGTGGGNGFSLWPDFSTYALLGVWDNQEIADKVFLSIDGVGSSLRRMYEYFDIKETKYKKVSLILTVIKLSKN